MRLQDILFQENSMKKLKVSWLLFQLPIIDKGFSIDWKERWFKIIENSIPLNTNRKIKVKVEK